jgi:hypothetical protein
MAEVSATDRAGAVRDPQLPAVHPHVTSRLQFAVAVLFNVLGGFGFGLGLAYISFYFTYNGMNTDCAGLLSADACLSAKFADCVWTSSLGAASSNGSAVTSAASCKYPDYETVFCGQYTTADTCSGVCFFDVTASECNHAAGFTPVESGVFACSFFVGGVFGPWIMNVFLHFFWFRPGAFACAATILFGTVLNHIARGTNAFWLLLISRFVYGVGSTALRQLGSLFAFRAVTPARASTAVSTIQVSTESGLLIAGLVTYFAAPTDFAANLQLERRFHGFLALQHFVAVMTVITAVLAKEPQPATPPAVPATGGGQEELKPEEMVDDMNSSGAAVNVIVSSRFPESSSTESADNSQQQLAVIAVTVAAVDGGSAPSLSTTASSHSGGGAVPIPAEGFLAPLLHHPTPLLVGVVMSAVFLFTGSSGFGAYVPLYSEDLLGIKPKFAPLLNTIITVPSGLVALGIRTLIRAPRRVFLIGTAAIAVVVSICGATAMPGAVDDTATRHRIALAMYVIFWFTFVACIGSSFFELALAIFPTSVRANGGGFVTGMMSLMSVVSNLLFPVVASAMAAPSGERLVGFAGWLFVGAGVSAVGLCVMVPLMHEASDDEDDNQVGEIADDVTGEAPSRREPDALHDAHAPTPRQPLYE